MSFTDQYYDKLAASLAKKMAKRNFEVSYAPTAAAAKEQALALIPQGATVTAGGSATMDECGVTEAVQNGDYQFIDRKLGQTQAEKVALVAEGMKAHTFLMSANALTREGEIVNIDGFGNRVALLNYGPQQVIIIVSLNKVVGSVEAAVDRIRNVAAPINTQRLDKKTPCHETGVCGDCYSLDSICGSIVITRLNLVPGRIKVILVGDPLGY